MRELYALNMGMEACSYCTTGVLIDQNNQPFLFRNLDWDEDFFREFTIRINATKNGEMVYRGVSFLGQVGIFTGMNKEFAAAINYRRSPNSSPSETAEWWGMLDNAAQQIYSGKSRWGASMLLRNVLESEESFSGAINRLETEETISPVYFIAASKEIGPEGGGVVITRDQSSYKTRSISDALSIRGIRSVVQTNIDYTEDGGYEQKQLETNWGGDDLLLNERYGMGPKTRQDKTTEYIRSKECHTQHDILGYISEPCRSEPVANHQTIFSSILTPSTGELWLKVLPADIDHVP